VHTNTSYERPMPRRTLT